MQNEKKLISSFKDLNAWKSAHDFVLDIYKNTKKYPSEEIYNLTSQMRRSAVSITSNIAEGYSRKSSKDKIHFYTITLGSLTEIQSQMEISKDLGYMSVNEHNELYNKSIIVHKLVNGLIKYLRSNI